MEQCKYSRQVLFAPIGRNGQERLRASKAVIIGCGALGTAQASLLARAGVGRLRIVDRDYVEESNLQRQVLFDESDAAERLPKAAAAERKLRRINSDVAIEGLVEDAQPNNIENLIAGFDLVLDGTDNFEARFLLNDAAVKLGIPWIYGAVVASYGVTMTIVPGRTACLACVMPQTPEGMHETCDTAGVIGPAVHWVAAVQTAEALKILCGKTERLHGQLMSADIWENRLQQVAAPRDTECRVCVQREFVHLEGEAPQQISLCGRNSVQIRRRSPQALDLGDLARRFERFGPVRSNAFLVQCNIDAYELTVFKDGRAIIKGVEDPALARSLYARYVGS